jgi:hypothetical protein
LSEVIFVYSGVFSMYGLVSPALDDSESDEAPGKEKLFVFLEKCEVKMVGEAAKIGLRIGVKVKQESTVDMRLKW